MSTVESMEVGGLPLYIGSQVLSPKYDMDAYNMATLSGGEAWDLCWELDWAKKLDPTLNPSPTNIIKYPRSHCNE